MLQGVASTATPPSSSAAAQRAESGSGLDPRLLVRLARSVPYMSGLSLDLAGFVASLVAADADLPLGAARLCGPARCARSDRCPTWRTLERPGLAVLAGLAFTVVAIAARRLAVPSPQWHALADPGLRAIVAHGALGMLLFTTALQRGSVTTAVDLTFAVEAVVPAGIGLAYLGDATRPGYAPIAAVGFVLTIGGTLALATHDLTRA